MKAVLHIGAEKTGSTSIQEFLFRNRNELSSRGFHFLQCAGTKNNRALPSYCLRLDRKDDYLTKEKIVDRAVRGQFQEDMTRRIHEEITGLEQHIHSVIISSEHFHSTLFHREELLTLRRLLERYFAEIEIIVYLRNQADTVESRYSTAIKGGSTRDLSEYIAKCSEINPRLNYDISLLKWEDVFGRETLKVGVYGRGEWPGGNLIGDFLAKVDSRLDWEGLDTNTSSNLPLSHTGQTVGKAINEAFPRDSDQLGGAQLWRRLMNITEEAFPGMGERISIENYRAINQVFAASNERVRQRYFPDRSVLFNEQTDLTPAPAQDAALQSGLAAILAEITKDSCLVPQHYINVFRDAAMLLEDNHPQQAYALMELAHLLRPTGTLIERKYLEYKELLERLK